MEKELSVSFIQVSGGSLVITPEYENALKEIEVQEKALKKKKDAIVNGIKKELATRTTDSVSLGAFNYIVIKPSIELAFDLDLLKEKHPDIYDECLVPTYNKGQVKFSPSSKGTKKGE